VLDERREKALKKRFDVALLQVCLLGLPAGRVLQPRLGAWHPCATMARDRIQRFTFAAAFIACSLRFLSGCVSYHEIGRPYSGTAWWLRNAGRPWRCYCAAPNSISAFAIGVPYTAVVVPFAAASAIGETVILPVDHLFGVPELPLPAEPSCEAFWGKPEPPAPPPSEPPARPVPATPSAQSPPK